MVRFLADMTIFSWFLFLCLWRHPFPFAGKIWMWRLVHVDGIWWQTELLENDGWCLPCWHHWASTYLPAALLILLPSYPAIFGYCIDRFFFYEGVVVSHVSLDRPVGPWSPSPDKVWLWCRLPWLMCIPDSGAWDAWSSFSDIQTAKTIRKILQFEEVPQLMTTLEHLQHTIFMGVFWFKMLVFHCFFHGFLDGHWKKKDLQLHLWGVSMRLLKPWPPRWSSGGNFVQKWAFLEGTIFPKVGNLWKFIYQWIQQHWNPRGGILMRFSGLQSEKQIGLLHLACEVKEAIVRDPGLYWSMFDWESILRVGVGTLYTTIVNPDRGEDMEKRCQGIKIYMIKWRVSFNRIGQTFCS